MTQTEIEKLKEDLFNEKINGLRTEVLGEMKAIATNQSNISTRMSGVENKLESIEKVVISLGKKGEVSYVYAGFVNAAIVAIISGIAVFFIK